MKKTLAFVLPMLVAAMPAFADDGQVSRSALADLGLGGMAVVSDAAGMEVRGMSSSASAYGGSLVFGQLVYQSNFFVASDLNGGSASAENAGLNVVSQASQGPQGSSVIGLLDIQAGNPAVQVFLGNFVGNAGNASNLGAAGLSAAMGN